MDGTDAVPKRRLNRRPKLAIEPFLKLWEQEVFALLLADGEITKDRTS